jgi:hypothetical protein
MRPLCFSGAPTTSRCLRTLLAVCLFAGGAACAERPDPRRTHFEIRGKDGVAKYDPKTGRLQHIDIDRNKDGRIETFSYWDASRVIRIEIDRDGDNRIDRWEHYDGNNKLASVGSSRRDDGIEDTWTYPGADGGLARVENDTDRDGFVDQRETFTAEAVASGARVLAVVDLDLDRNGTPRRRLLYGPDGTFQRAEVLR